MIQQRAAVTGEMKMSKLEGSVFVSKDTDMVQNVVAYQKRLSPPGVTTTSNYNNQLTTSHNRSNLLIGHSRPKKALPYRVFAGKWLPYDYDYTYMVGSSMYQRWGKTPVAASIGAGVPLTWGTKLSGGLRVPDVSQNMENRATTEALNVLSSNKANLYAVLAEMVESATTIVDIATRVVRALILFKKGRWSQGYNVLTGRRVRGRDTRASRAWLTYQYAIRPMMYDIYGIIEFSKMAMPPVSPLVRGRRYLSTSYGLPAHPFHYKTWHVEGKCEVGCEVSITATINSYERFWLNQLAVYNPALLGWELMTLSFVIDWLIPIGNYLEALTADIGLNFFDGYVNTKTVTSFGFRGTNVDQANGALPGGRIENVCQLRTPLLSVPMPGIYIKSPFSVNNLTNALALFAVLRK